MEATVVLLDTSSQIDYFTASQPPCHQVNTRILMGGSSVQKGAYVIMQRGALAD
jgi:hypothetical protein